MHCFVPCQSCSGELLASSSAAWRHLAWRLSFGQKVFARKGTVLIEEGSENSALFVVGLLPA